RDQRAPGEVVAEYLSADLREAIAIANVGNEHRHLNHVTELASRFFQRGINQLEDLSHLTFEITGKRFARVVHGRDLPAKPNRLAPFGNHRERVAALLRTFALDELLCV